MSVADLVVNFAYVALFASTFTRTVTWLRSMLVVAAIAFIVFGSIEGIWSIVAWNIAIGSMHAFRIARDILQQRSVALTNDEESLRDEFFPGLSDFDFNMLWSMGQQVGYSDEVVIAQQSLPQTTSLVLSGTAVIEQNNQVVRGIRRGGLLGEMSLVSGRPSEVNVIARGGVVVHQWDQRHLTSLDQVHPASARAFRELLQRDLVEKARPA